MTSRHAVFVKCCQVKLGRTECLTCLKMKLLTALKLSRDRQPRQYWKIWSCVLTILHLYEQLQR